MFIKKDANRCFHSTPAFAAILLFGCILANSTHAATTEPVRVADGIVQPRVQVSDTISTAMQFLKKADGAYVPGRMDGELAGYFESAFVHEDGSRSDRKLSFPARQHAYFIFTFLRYHAYTGQREWLLRARDLADWNLAHSTPPSAVYSNVPYSTFSNGKPGGSRDVDSIEPDKSAFLGSGYIAVYEATADRKYLDAALNVAETLTNLQRDDGSWPFRVVPETGVVRQDFGGAPVFFVEFYQNLLRHLDQPAWRRAREQALILMIQRNIKDNLWGTYHEDVLLKPEGYLSAEPMSFTAAYLFRNGKTHPEYIDMGRTVLRRMEERLVHTTGHAAAPAPAVSEQIAFDHLMPGHTARYCMALAHLYAITGDDEVRRKALSGVNAVTFMQSQEGLFRTFFHSVNPAKKDANRRNWYSQHLYTVCHVLELMPSLPELAPKGESHILGSDAFLKQVTYTPRGVKYESITPARTVIKIPSTPRSVIAGDKELPKTKELSPTTHGWTLDPKGTLIIQHPAAQIEVRWQENQAAGLSNR
jgi:hypothetical protein